MAIREKGINPRIIEETKVLVNCYRIKIERVGNGIIRVYCYNSRDKGGDTAIEIDKNLDEIIIWAEGKRGKKVILENLNPSLRATEEDSGETEY